MRDALVTYVLGPDTCAYIFPGLSCAREGATVIMFDMMPQDAAPLEGGVTTCEALAALNDSSLKMKYVQGDSSCWADVDRAVTETVAEFGRLDVYVNCAAIGAGKSLTETTEVQNVPDLLAACRV